MTGSEDYIVDLLVFRGLITDEQVVEARDEAEAHGTAVLESLENLKYIAEEDVLMVIASEYGMDSFDFSDYKIPPDVVDAVPRDIARRYSVVPVMRTEVGTLIVAMADPTDLEVLDSVRYILKCDVEGVVASKKQVQQALGYYYGDVEDSVESFLDDITEGTLEISEVATSDVTTEFDGDDDDEAPIIRLVSLLILEAFRTRTSDIHLEPLEKRFRVRYRIDGVLHEVENPPKYLQKSIISRLKLMAGMDLSEHRVPQDGRIQIPAMGRTLDLRVSDIPATHGESIVMRILDKSSVMLGIGELGFFQDDQDLIMRIIGFPDGIFLVTGPTGSGKTTSLYSFLHTLNQPTRKIITAEDPVEYELSGINQVQMNPEIGLTFVRALRAMLRQAPNVIMVGEIRDSETGNIAINAALTGHLVFSTLHTNDAPSAITRMMDMGIKAFLVASAVRAIMAQRLVRRICKNCAEPTEPSEAELDILDMSSDDFENIQLVRGAGCSECSKGYKGRMGIYEIFILDESIQSLIYGKADAGVIKDRARVLGMRSLREDGLRKAAAGITTLEEVIRLTVADDDSVESNEEQESDELAAYAQEAE
ncbi:MAG: Flp pilus assembly complex ATPase component TadA [Lentisphaeria bacterium]|nr:Flp pilus assembly complex ATPase component TadA [Lentisphaeria bacterium]